MKHGIPTCSQPDEPTKLYMRVMYREWFYGPFYDEAAVIAAVQHLDKADWDYDCFCVVSGANPLPKDYVLGFPFVPGDMRDRIEKARTVPKEATPPTDTEMLDFLQKTQAVLTSETDGRWRCAACSSEFAKVIAYGATAREALAAAMLTP